MNEPDDFDYRTLSDDLRDFIEVVLAFVIAIIVFGSIYACAAEPVIDVNHGRLVSADGGVFDVSGGAWLSDVVLLERASQIVATQAELDALRAKPRPSTAALVLTNVLTGIVQTVGATMTACYIGTGNALCVKR